MPGLVTQVVALSRKNLLVLSRSPIQVVLVLLSPLVALFLAIASGGALAASFRGVTAPAVSTTDPPVHTAALPKCTSPTGCPTTTPRVFWAPAGQDAYHGKIMEALARDLDLKMGVDVIGLSSLDDLATTAIDRQAAVLAERPVNFALAFTTFAKPKTMPALPIAATPPPTNNTSGNGRGPTNPANRTPNPLVLMPLLTQFQQSPTFEPPTPAGDLVAAKARVASVNGTHYTLWPLMTESWTFMDPVLPNIAIDSKPILFKHHLDQAIVRTRAEMEGKPAPTLKVSLSHFPLPQDVSNNPFSGSGSDVDLEKARESISKRLGNSFTASFLILGFCPLLLVMANMVGNEKNTGLISNLRKLGMSELAYWLSTYLTAALLILLSSLLALAATPAFPESFQLYTWRPDVLLSVNLLTGLHMTAMGLFIVACLNSAYAANMLCGFLCMACIIVAAIFGFNDSISMVGQDLSGGTSAAARALTRASMWHSMFDPPVKGWVLSALFPFMPMGKVFTELSYYMNLNERTRNAVTWANAAVTISRTFEDYDRTARARYTYTTISTQATMLSTVGLVVATFALSVFMNQVVGGPYPLWFPLTPGYWGWGKDGDEQVNAEAERDQALVVKHLKKSFTTGWIKRRTVKAVKDVSLTVRKGRVLSLLGTNGAGKSTTIGMITGLFRPDAGAVSVFGTANLAKIQQTIGVVTQSDITWPLLTAAEHVQLYASFKDVAGTPEYVADRLLQVGLDGNADQQVGKFSGGMRKRLCVVLCSIGEPPLCILDEPTSSLDPINRRKVWKFIQSLKSHAAVVLTTHLMDEADSLGDEICIIDDGQVKASGSSLALKSKYGSGYEVTLLTNGHVSHTDMRELVCAHAPEATLVQRSTDMFSATIPKSSPVTPLVRFLRSDDPQRVAMVQGWEISNETLEQVFLTVAEQAKAERDAAAGVGSDASSSSSTQQDLQPFELPKFVPKKSLAHQIAAVMAKDWAFQMRQPKATIATFVLVIAVLFGYVKLMDLTRETVCAGGYLAVPKQNPGDSFADSSFGQVEYTCDLSVPRQQFVKSAGACVPGLDLACVVGDYRLPSGYQGGSSTGARYWVQGDGAAADRLLANTNAPLWSLVTAFAPDMNISAPVIRKMAEDPVATIKANLQRMANAAEPVPPQCKFRVSYREDDKVYQGDKAVEPKVELDGLVPDYAVKINSFSAQASDIHIVMPLMNYGSQKYLSIARPANASGCLVVKPNSYAPTAQQTLNQLLSQVDRESVSAISMSSIDGKLYELLQGTTVAQLRAVTDTNEGVFANLRNMPTIRAPQAIPALVTFLMPMSFYVLFFSYLLLPFYEKEAQLFEFYRVNGLSVAACWLGHYLFALTLTLPSLIASTVIVAVYIPTASIVSYLLLTLIAIHGSISMAFLLAGLLSSVTMARLISFLFPPVATVVSASLLITGDTPSFLASLLFPPLPYAHGLRSIVVTATPKWGLSLAGLAMSTVYLSLAIALMTLTDKSPFAILKSKLLGLIRGGSGSTAANTSQQLLVDVEGSAADADDEDDEVRREREMLLAGGKETDGLAVKAVQLNKSFGAHQVLKNMNMAIAPGVTYGLLGANGCGKSTFLSIVMGSARPTSGNVWVGGKLSTTRDLSSIVGVCPQADLVIGDLTVEENLQFFARLRGAALWGKELEHLVSRCIELVGLKEARDRAAHALSGGMKRRLSMGIAVIGSPQLILADEPSQGLDASNKLGIWKLLGRIRESKEATIIITTHFLSEADALCSRIGIMAGGRMRVLGNQLTLKSKFGSGYFVHMQVPVIVTEQAGQSLQQLALAAENAALDTIELRMAAHLGVDQQQVRVQHDHQEHLAEQRARGGLRNAQDASWAWEIKVKLALPAASDLGSVFEFMASGQLGIVDWGIQQSSLEDVFVAVSTKYS